MGSVLLFPKTTTGPISGILDFYEESSILTTAQEIQFGHDLTISETELPEIYRDFIDFAQTDPWLKQYHPGGPPEKRFLLGKTLFSLFKAGLFFGFPAFLIWLLNKSDSKT